MGSLKLNEIKINIPIAIVSTNGCDRKSPVFQAENCVNKPQEFNFVLNKPIIPNCTYSQKLSTHKGIFENIKACISLIEFIWNSCNTSKINR